jgi:hypothetical protein
VGLPETDRGITTFRFGLWAIEGQLGCVSTIGFALLASEKFSWDAEDLAGDVIHDWFCPEINYLLTLENVQRFKNWLLEKEPYLTKVQPQTRASAKPSQERLISRVEKKSLPKKGR